MYADKTIPFSISSFKAVRVPATNNEAYNVVILVQLQSKQPYLFLAVCCDRYAINNTNEES